MDSGDQPSEPSGRMLWTGRTDASNQRSVRAGPYKGTAPDGWLVGPNGPARRKSVPVNLPEPIKGDARDQVGKIVGKIVGVPEAGAGLPVPGSGAVHSQLTAV